MEDEIKSVEKCVWADAGKTAINCMVVFTKGAIAGVPAPFTAVKDDCEAHGRLIFENAIRGEYGEIAPHVPFVDPFIDKWKIEAAFLAEGIDPETLLSPRDRAFWRQLTAATKDDAILTAIKDAAGLSTRKFNTIWSNAHEVN